jgi:XTP/dITP diphosphohydrolase
MEPTPERSAKQPVRLVVSTRNAHKLSEIQTIVGPSFECQSLESFPSAPKVVEDAKTFEGNATKKAVELARWLASQPLSETRPAYVLADDSGLEVDALNGAPGVNSARFAGGSDGNSPDTANNARLLQLLADVPVEKRTGRFRCVLALTVLPSETGSDHRVCYADEAELMVELFSGTCEGRIGFDAKGSGGFGYDPLFVPEGMSETFAELGEGVKNGISHRAKALEKLKRRLKG